MQNVTATLIAYLHADILEIEGWEAEVRRIVALEQCPPVIRLKICNSCSYHDLCFAGEEG